MFKQTSKLCDTITINSNWLKVIENTIKLTAGEENRNDPTELGKKIEKALVELGKKIDEKQTNSTSFLRNDYRICFFYMFSIM